MSELPCVADGAGETGLSGAVADLSPAYFGLVMATGIVSIAADLQGMRTFALILFAVNIGAWRLQLLGLAPGNMPRATLRIDAYETGASP